MFPFRFLAFVAALVGFAEDRRERFRESRVELFVVGDVEARAARWQQAADALEDLYARQRADRDQAAQTNNEAKRHVELVRAEVAEPLTAQARKALTDWQAADTAENTARDRARTVGRFKKRRATADHDTAQGAAREAARKLTKAWGEPPRWNENQAAWVERVTRPRIDADPRVIEAEQQRATAAHALHAALKPNPWPSVTVYARIFGEEAVQKNPGAYVHARPAHQVEDATRTAQHARAEAETLRTLTPAEAVERIKQTHAAEETKREAARMLAERERQLRAATSPRSSPGIDGRGLGL